MKNSQCPLLPDCLQHYNIKQICNKEGGKVKLNNIRISYDIVAHWSHGVSVAKVMAVKLILHRPCPSLDPLLSRWYADGVHIVGYLI